MTSGERDIDEQNELEEAIDANNASEALRKKKMEQLLQNVGNVENANPAYIENIIQESGGASSSGVTQDASPQNKPKTKSKINIPDLEEPVGQPAALKPRTRSQSREPSAAAKAKAKAREIAK